MKPAIIIQARMGSIRLPGKMLLVIMGKTVLEHLVERVKKAKEIGDIIIATTTRKEDREIAELAKRLGIKSYCGDETDVLNRFYEAAKKFNLEHIVRITGDCPLMDPRVVDKAVVHYFKSGADYCSNVLERTFPDGEDVEVFSFSALKHAWEDAVLPSEREHVTPYIIKHPELFKLADFKNKVNISEKRWTLDKEEDFRFIKTVFESLYPSKADFGINDILEFLNKNPRLEEINKNIIPNEGYLKSLEEDKISKSGRKFRKNE